MYTSVFAQSVEPLGVTGWRVGPRKTLGREGGSYRLGQVFNDCPNSACHISAIPDAAVAQDNH